MRRILWFRRGPAAAPEVWHLSAGQHRELLELLSDIGLHIIYEARGPVPLLTFGRRVMERLHSSQQAAPPLPHFADALKRIIRDMQHDRLRVMSPSEFLGVGYVYDARDPDTWPVRSSR